MMSLPLDRRIAAFTGLSSFLSALATGNPDTLPDELKGFYNEFFDLLPVIYEHNGWFTRDFVLYQLDSLAEATSYDNLEKWLAPYRDKLENRRSAATVAVIMAGNIPFVGFSDFISVLMAGHKFLGKLSSKDTILPKFITDVLLSIEPGLKDYIVLTEENLRGHVFDAVIATGSDNSARYFEYYFSSYPRIIRKNRTSVAVLTGNESDDDLSGLADDVFLYFGLGCRNVSKVYLPRGYDLDKLFRAFYKYRDLINHNKYANNYEYNRAIYLLNREEFYDNGFVLLKPEDVALVSPTAVVYYQFYDSPEIVNMYLQANKDKIQTVVSPLEFNGMDRCDFGRSQRPMLWQYPDGIDIMEFLLEI